MSNAQRQEHAPQPERSEWMLTEREIREHAESSAMRNALAVANGRHQARRFTGAPITQLGDL